jgi:hypothetical protein
VSRSVNTKEVPIDAFFWKGRSNISTMAALEKRVASMASRHGLTVEQADSVLSGWYAYTQSILENVELPNVDRASKTARVFRTVSEDVPKLYGMTHSDQYDHRTTGKDNVPFKQGVNESTSTVWAKYIMGEQVYGYETPICRIGGIYQTARPGTTHDHGLFASDHENEFTSNLQGIRARFLGHIHHKPSMVAIPKPSSDRSTWGTDSPY